MGTINEETTTRAAQKECDADLDSRRGSDAGCKSGSTGHQQERVDRTNSQKSSIIRTGATITGGMLRQLISEYEDQMALKQVEIQRYKELIKSFEGEVNRLQNRINEFNLLKKELEQELEQQSEEIP
jgi:hypothetical protein